nr:hypothetical protein [Tanacetum cinerariifolium]
HTTPGSNSFSFSLRVWDYVTGLMKSRWTHLIRNVLTILNEISDCCGLKLLDVIVKYGKIIPSSRVTREFFISLRDFSNRSCVYEAYLQGLQLSAEDQKSLSEKKKKEEHFRLLLHQ